VLTIPQDIVIVLTAILAALFFWWLLRRIWPSALRQHHNDITGWQVSVLGTTYAVIVGFMLFAVWSDFRVADQNAQAEASCLINLYWVTAGLPEGQRNEFRRLSSEYAEAMITEEWPAMYRGKVGAAGRRITQQLWAVASQPQSLSVSQQVNLTQTLAELSNLTHHRRIRELQSETTIPGVLWTLLVVGAAITIMSACLFGSEYPALHMLQVVTLAFLLSMSLVTIADINRPFQGAVRVSPRGFENAKRTFDNYQASQGGR
jgi:hypothetical protein